MTIWAKDYFIIFYFLIFDSSMFNSWLQAWIKIKIWIVIFMIFALGLSFNKPSYEIKIQIL